MFRFGQVAAAIGIPEQRLRNWLHREQVHLSGEREKGGWRTFAEEDVFFLAIVAQLAQFGCPVPTALDEARKCLASTNFKTWEGLPTYIYAGVGEGGWKATTDKGLLWAYFGRQPQISVVEIAVPVCFAEVRRRLAHGATEV